MKYVMYLQLTKFMYKARYLQNKYIYHLQKFSEILQALEKYIFAYTVAEVSLFYKKDRLTRTSVNGFHENKKKRK